MVVCLRVGDYMSKVILLEDKASVSDFRLVLARVEQLLMTILDLGLS